MGNLDATKQQAAQLLGEVPRGAPLGTALHTGIMRHVVSPCLEAVALRMTPDVGIEVLLRQRGPAEPSYPGQWHCPGSAQRTGERMADVLARLSTGESLGEVVFYEEVSGPSFLWEEERGTVESRIFLVDIAAGATKLQWYNVLQLPEPMVDHHAAVIIPRAVMHFCLKRGGKQEIDWLLRHGGFRQIKGK